MTHNRLCLMLHSVSSLEALSSVSLSGRGACHTATYLGVCRLIGALLAGFTANKIGRKRTIQLGSIIATVGQYSAALKVPHYVVAEFAVQSRLRYPNRCDQRRDAYRRSFHCWCRYRMSVHDCSLVPGELRWQPDSLLRDKGLTTHRRIFQAEISPPHARGLLSGWTQQMIGFGFLVASLVGKERWDEGTGYRLSC